MDPFFYLSQPACQSASIALIGLVWLRLRRYRTATIFLATSLFWLSLCATPAFVTWLQRGLEARYPPRDASAYPTADVIVVLGGGELPRFSDDFDDKAAARDTRAGFGLELFRKAKAPFMLLSGGEHEATQMTRLLTQQGVPAAALLTEDASLDTHQNALYCAAILRHWKLRRILLVTSPLHMHRAAASFEHQGFTVIPAPASDAVLTQKNAAPWLPRRATLRDSRRCLREYFGLWIYRLRGWA